MVNKMRNVGLLFLPLMLCACLAQSNIQANYMAQQKLCQGISRVASEEAGAEAESAPVSVSQFAQCMNKSGWHVALPKAPAAAAPAAQQPSTVQQPAPVQPQPQPVAPVATPAENPAQNAAPVPVAPVPQAPVGGAIYQPARPGGAADVYYGTGAGRQF